jgi:hypothetical protein
MSTEIVNNGGMSGSERARARIEALRERKAKNGAERDAEADDDDDAESKALEREGRAERKAKREAAFKAHEAERQAEWDARIAAIRAIATAAYEGDYMGGVELLAAAYLEHCDGRRVMAIDELANADSHNRDYE